MKTEERKHRRWDGGGYLGQLSQEHNALYDAWEQAEARARELEEENKVLMDKDLGHVQMIYNLESEIETANAAIAELKPTQPPGVPDMEGLCRIYDKRIGNARHSWDKMHEAVRKRDMEAMSAVRDAVLASIGPVLTREEVEKLADEEQRIGTEQNDWESAFIGLRNRITAHLPAALGAGLADTPAAPSDEKWREKVKAAHAMVHALCQPRGSEGSREWIMSIPADASRDPDLVITHGLMAAERRIEELEAIAAPLQAEIERLRGHNEFPATFKALSGQPNESILIAAQRVVAERDSLREKLAAAEAVHNELRTGLGIDEGTSLVDTVWDLRDKAEDAWMQQSTARPARVRFDVTAEDQIKTWREIVQKNSIGYVIEAPPEWLWLCLKGYSDYLAAHAVIDVPEGVPSAELLRYTWEGLTPAEMGEYENAFVFARAMLAPYLHPPRPDCIFCDFKGKSLADLKEHSAHCEKHPLYGASVDPKLCEEPFSLENDTYELISIQKDNAIIVLNSDTWQLMSPTDAHRAGMWLLSFAASQGIDIRLPVKWYGAIDYAAPEPIATAETLEQLAEIAENNAEIHVSLEEETFTVNWAEIATAILRAAKPEIDANAETLQEKWEELTSRNTLIEQDYADMFAWFNSRIRYRVEVPTDERVRIAAEDLVKEIENHRRIEWPGVGEWGWVIAHACDNLTAIQIRSITREVVARCDRLQDAALGKDGE